MWQASAERILLAMTYGDFGAALNAGDNTHVRDLLDRNVILEMDGRASSSVAAFGGSDVCLCEWMMRRVPVALTITYLLLVK